MCLYKQVLADVRSTGAGIKCLYCRCYLNACTTVYSQSPMITPRQQEKHLEGPSFLHKDFYLDPEGFLNPLSLLPDLYHQVCQQAFASCLYGFFSGDLLRSAHEDDGNYSHCLFLDLILSFFIVPMQKYQALSS